MALALRAEMKALEARITKELEGGFDGMDRGFNSMMKWSLGMVMGLGSLLAILMSIYRFMG